MLSQSTYALVTCLISLCSAIRVDYNTNSGAILPPTSRPTVRPALPYREPAPIWEDQSNDIPNPNPYNYILPPPSRPRTNGNSFSSVSLGQRPLDYYGNLLLPSDVNAFYQPANTNSVGGSLAAKYIPNVGIRYTAVVAPYNSDNNKNYSNNVVNRNNGGSNYFGVGNKLHGKYNEKTKKYKAYEKVKYVPQSYYPLFELAPPIDKPYTSVFNQDQLIRSQQLPRLEAPIAFRTLNNDVTEAGIRLETTTTKTTTPTTIPTTTPALSSTAGQSKLAHEKDQVFTKSESKINKSLLKIPKADNHSANALLSMKSR